MAPKVKLIYFDGRGRAEVLRFVLKAAGIDFEDVRIDMSDWDDLKKKYPFQQLPALEYDGEHLCQSMAICRFLARKHGLSGSNPLEDCHIDTVVDHVNEIFEAVLQVYMSKEEEEKKKRAKVIIEETIPKVLAGLEGILKQAGGEYFVGNKLTWADVVVVERLRSLVDPTDPLLQAVKHLSSERVNAMKNFPLLQELVKRVEAKPGIREHLQSRKPNADEQF